MITKQEVIDSFCTNSWDDGDRYSYSTTEPRIYKHKTDESLELHYFGMQNSKLFKNGILVGYLKDYKIYMGNEVIHE